MLIGRRRCTLSRMDAEDREDSLGQPGATQPGAEETPDAFHECLPFASSVRLTALSPYARAFRSGSLAHVAGGALWGAVGMFLAIPLAGIGEIVFGMVPDLEPLARLLGPITLRKPREGQMGLPTSAPLTSPSA